jgi:hypothetical protein
MEYAGHIYVEEKDSPILSEGILSKMCREIFIYIC